MSTPRQPTLRVLADGSAIAGVAMVEVRSVNHYAADQFSIEIAGGSGFGGWADAVDTLLEVFIGVDGAEVSLVSGCADSVIVDALRGKLTVEGRDRTAALIQTPTREAFANQTASDIAIVLATRHGLTPVVTPTSDPVGRFYSADHTSVTLDRLSRAGSEWDLLVLLAQEEGFDVFVNGASLYFQPATVPFAPKLTLRPFDNALGPANLIDLQLERRMTLAGSISVQVKSWNTQLQAAFQETATRPGSGGAATSYAFVRPNLTAADAMRLAQRKLEAVTRHEVVLTATMPGELALRPRDAVALWGTGSVFDTRYVVDEVHRRVSVHGGYLQTVRAHVPFGLGGTNGALP